MPITLRVHNQKLSICQLPPEAPAPPEILAHPLTCFFRTHDEATLVCPAALTPKNTAKVESGFIALELVGPFAFDQTGILIQVTAPLAAAGVSIVSLSSFNTDYVLIKADQWEAAIAALKKAGHRVDKN